ncbi:MAG: surface-adhesin E family protein [Gammaproteobacteria bacterium]
MKRCASILLLIVMAGCASAPPASKDDWAYIGNDPEGTQNILMSAVTPVPHNGVLTTAFRFQYTAPRSVTDDKGKSYSYIELRDQVSVNCDNQSLQILHKSYYDVDDNLVLNQASPPNADSTVRIMPGGVEDIMYQAVCGRSIGWAYIGASEDGTQKIYVMGKATNQSTDASTQAWFKTEYDGAHSLIAAPSMQHVSYITKISTLQVDCATYEISLLHEVYYDADDHKVFDIQPGVDKAESIPATADSVRGLMYQAACGRPTELRYLGLDPHDTQKVYLIGKPTLDAQQIASARFHVYYLKPGTLTTGPVIHTISYSARTVELDADCSALTYQVRSEVYLDDHGDAVFTITPPAADAPNVGVAPGSLSEMMWKTACGGAG